jgi:hypothetical protein
MRSEMAAHIQVRIRSVQDTLLELYVCLVLLGVKAQESDLAHHGMPSIAIGQPWP